MSEAKESEALLVEDGDETADDAPPKKSRKKLIIIIVAVLLLASGGAAAWFLTRPAEVAEAHEVTELPEAFVDIPAIQVSLRTSDGRSSVLKLHVMLVPGEKTPEEIEPRLPLLLDRFQPFLRELRPEDMAGSAGTYRIKEELLFRTNQALGEGAVRDVLIQDLMQS